MIANHETELEPMELSEEDNHDGDSTWIQMRQDVPFKVAKRRLLAHFEQTYLRSLLARYQGNISAVSRESLLSRKHVRTLISKYGLRQKQAVTE